VAGSAAVVVLGAAGAVDEGGAAEVGECPGVLAPEEAEDARRGVLVHPAAAPSASAAAAPRTLRRVTGCELLRSCTSSVCPAARPGARSAG
jgi:hypothetical protein